MDWDSFPLGEQPFESPLRHILPWGQTIWRPLPATPGGTPGGGRP